MRLLLDTHIWLWSLQESERLGRRVVQALKDPQNELWLSPVSTWEAVVLHQKNRIRLIGDLADWISYATAPVREAPLTHEIAFASHYVPLQHHDPADRFIAATAQVLDLTLVTADARLLGLGNIATLANR